MIQEIQNYARTSMRLFVEELTGFADDGKYSARLNVSLKLLLLKNCFKTLKLSLLCSILFILKLFISILSRILFLSESGKNIPVVWFWSCRDH